MAAHLHTTLLESLAISSEEVGGAAQVGGKQGEKSQGGQTTDEGVSFGVRLEAPLRGV